MTISSHDLIRGLMFAVPALFVGIWTWFQKRRAKENAKISSILRDRKP
ncbi:MAG TPA: hypothetical protein VF848_01045 [Steroidobacteraceae bacterium]